MNWAPLVGAGKMPPYFPPAVSKAVELLLIMQSGIVLLGNGDPATTPAGATFPGQLANWIEAGTAVRLGSEMMFVLPLGRVVGIPPPVPAPPASGYSLVSGTVWLINPP